MNKNNPSWNNARSQSGVRYECGYCGTDTTPSGGWDSAVKGSYQGFVLLCTNCNKPSFVEVINTKVKNTTPARKFGREVSGLPNDVQTLYDEARTCTPNGAFTSAVLTCRKILMHVSVEKGADKGKSFLYYVEFLSQHNYIPPDGKAWVDHIRTKSNEANHEIVIMDREEADDLITFTEMLLRMIYEFPHRLSQSDVSSEST